MRLIRLIGFYFEVMKGITRIVIYLSKKCQKLLVLVLIAIIAIYMTCGLTLAIITTTIGFVYIVYNFCDYLLYNPNDPIDSRANVLSPMAFNLSFESHFITTDDKININVLLIKRPDNEYKWCPTIVYFHGNAGNIGHRLQNCYELYHEIGCNILLVEYRGYGLSGGHPSERGLYLDASAALNYLMGRPDIDSHKIVVFGRSLGGAVAVELARRANAGAAIAAVIIENTFTSLPDIGRQLFNCRLIRWLPNWFYKNQFTSVDKISEVTAPALFISGLSDELIPSSMMTSLYALCGSAHKELHRLDGTHNFTWKCANYYHIWRLFLAKVFQHGLQPDGPFTPLSTDSNTAPSPQPPPPQQLYNQTLITFDDKPIDI
ncbi:unnamed protein product [Oppiella nova]|uniref:Protein ABHD13 n=1 Tax=Oppiella nova TaxID=334625 RepID=A0A7R9LJV7_9ACAR|nr:unnamed protein product [Oppiella nova]CAG2164364.1 unnamed protein product [Oppiella nova]